LLSDHERQRYLRQTAVSGVGLEGQARLKAVHVLCVGAGGLGNAVLQALASSGLGRITVYDPDVVELSNLARQPLFMEGDVGDAKACVVVRKCLEQNPHIGMSAVQASVHSGNVESLLADVDFVVDCTDNAVTKYLLNDVCVAKGVPLVMASMAQWSGYCLLVAGRGCYRCLFPQEDAPVPSCAGSGVLSTLPALLGAIQANVVVLSALGCAQEWVGRLLRCDVRRAGFEVLRFGADDSCRVCGSAGEAGCHAELGLMTVQALRAGDFAGVSLLDVRTDEERAQGHIGGDHIPLAELTQRYQKLDPDQKWVVYCRSGARSEQAGRFLCAQGFGRVYNLVGGMLAWDRV
jgi:sulfur-carrier protein adenylyltransferase/sulfurtransferase